MQILRAADLTPTPWKNGGGITRNIATGETGGGDHSAWRISRADVATDGAFSNFAGLQRILTVARGAGMVLTHPGGQIIAGPREPVTFDGALDIMAELLDGPITDVNLMFDPALCTGRAEVLEGAGAQDITPPQPGLTVLHALAGRPAVAGETLTSADTAFIEKAATLQMASGDAVLALVLNYLPQSASIKLRIARL